MATDLSILKLLKDNTIELDGVQTSSVYGMNLLQQLITLLFSTGSYREGSEDNENPLFLLDFLNGANIMTAEAADSIIVLICSQTLQMLDDSDKENIESFSGHWEDGTIVFTLKLQDGTTLTGALNA